MKKNDWILIAATGLYSFLFYKQSAGINFIIFNIAMLYLLAYKNNNELKSRGWWLAFVGCIGSSLCVGWYGNSLAVFANIVSLSILSGLSVSPQSSVLLSLLFSGYSYLTAVFYMCYDSDARLQKNTNSQFRNIVIKVWLVFIPLVISLVFFFMYRASNPLFNELAKKINIDFVSWDWLFFNFGGFLILYGFFYHRKIKYLSNLDKNVSDHLSPNYSLSFELFGKSISMNDENFSGIILFVLLNLLLLVVNSLDLNFLFFGGKLPSGLTYSAFVHQGIGMLIVSILIAIAIILFYFRGSLNFYEKNNTIKMLAYLWILQNIFMLISTGYKNELYIIEYGLTYKRLGVYFYLILSGIGLMTTFVKIIKLKSNIYLFRINGWLFYGVFIVSVFFNWDAIIFNCNVYKAKQFDMNYLLSLSDTNLPNLFTLSQNTSSNHKEFSVSQDKNYQIDSCDSVRKPRFNEQVSLAISDFQINRENQDWQSCCYDQARVHRKLLELNAYKKIIRKN